jgi:hypothetical protein
VTLGIGRDIGGEVDTYLAPQPHLVQLPKLYLHSDTPLVSPQHTNKAAGIIKAVVAEALAQWGATKLHLFYAGPSHLALFLGHRLNATASVQCYEWVRAGEYVPTCLL